MSWDSVSRAASLHEVTFPSTCGMVAQHSSFLTRFLSNRIGLGSSNLVTAVRRTDWRAQWFRMWFFSTHFVNLAWNLNMEFSTIRPGLGDRVRIGHDYSNLRLGVVGKTGSVSNSIRFRGNRLLCVTLPGGLPHPHQSINSVACCPSSLIVVCPICENEFEGTRTCLRCDNGSDA